MRGKLAVSLFLFFSTWRGSFVAVVGIFPKLELVWGFASFENYENDKYVETINDNVYSWYYDCVAVSGLFLKLHAVMG